MDSVNGGPLGMRLVKAAVHSGMSRSDVTMVLDDHFMEIFILIGVEGL